MVPVPTKLRIALIQNNRLPFLNRKGGDYFAEIESAFVLALLSALLAALVVIVIVVAVWGDLTFLREVEHEAHYRNVEVVELNGDFLQIALHGYVTARYNVAFGVLGATGSAVRCTMEKLCRRLFAGSV